MHNDSQYPFVKLVKKPESVISTVTLRDRFGFRKSNRIHVF